MIENNPSLRKKREKKDQETLWAGLNQGTVQVVATDHCPFMWEQKKMGENGLKLLKAKYEWSSVAELVLGEGDRKKGAHEQCCAKNSRAKKPACSNLQSCLRSSRITRVVMSLCLSSERNTRLQ